jgi:hypothetical protein
LPDDIYTLKVSHLFWDISWDKHMFDVVFLTKKGCKLDVGLFEELYEHWKTVHGPNKRTDYSMSGKDFFNNGLTKGYDHEQLHRIINPSPTYLKVLVGEVQVSEEKFCALTHKEKVALTVEEAMVMAFERMGSRNYRDAYYDMIKQLVLKHVPVYQALHIIQNYLEIRHEIYDYKKLINSKLNI